MLKKLTQNNTQESTLYNNILLLSRNRLFYTKFDLSDSFQNRIHLIFLHISFLFIKIKQNMENKKYKNFYQKTFNLIFNKIELNMRELGYGDINVNKNMKYLVKTFYNILLNCEKYDKKSINLKSIFFIKCLEIKNIKNKANINDLIDYFDRYRTFCFDLSLDSVLKGKLNFNY